MSLRLPSSHPAVALTRLPSRRALPLRLVLASTALVGSMCHKGPRTNQVSGCGDQVLEGYLVTDSTCPNQAFPTLPDYRSKQGYRCSLDVYLSPKPPTGPGSEVCEGAPVTSQCFLETLGLVPITTGEGIVSYPLVSLVGTIKTVRVCKLLPGCQAKASTCVECAPSPVFIPCGGALRSENRVNQHTPTALR